ncbi:right-handed parallel beta-helix repeat-containing protein [Micromonospora sp. WMMA1363]|uniref:right-handed parallel beta-helix repeat-containing protein n=1 Tax=Micromonospora sp. WMMA1363 TaxID=3053985 RepID=UPI00259CB9D0|nr:right-handed parallel beta-helix repeat-containing protein [Micromonospora sp. WMMA1363]MDM4719532.1 right-handed parallel beta-helix repeat-containing protein [Micromonospora sp. WMMA1363]
MTGLAGVMTAAVAGYPGAATPWSHASLTLDGGEGDRMHQDGRGKPVGDGGPATDDPAGEWSEREGGDWGGDWGVAGDPGWRKDGHDGKKAAVRKDGHGGKKAAVRKDGHDGKKAAVRKDGHGGKKAAVRKVPCDANALIAAITAANQAGGGALRLAERCTYTLTANEDNNGLPPVFQPIAIHGQGATIVRAAEAASFRIFNVTTGGDLSLWDLTVAGGRVEDENGGGILVGEGARLSLDRVTVRDNTVAGEDGSGGGVAIDNGGKVTITRSTITRNTAVVDGGGLHSDNGSLTVTKSKLTHNVAGDEGGAYFNDDGVGVIRHTLISDNHATTGGGGVDNAGDLSEVAFSTIARNTAGQFGGGVFDSSSESLLLRHVTVAGNTAPTGGGIYITSNIGATIEDSKIVHNTATDGDGGGIAINGEQAGDEAVVAVRRTKISSNRATGAAGRAGGIFFNPPDDSAAELVLTDVRITNNTAQVQPGGVYSNGTVRAFGTNIIVDNRPTNCVGSPQPVPDCFG